MRSILFVHHGDISGGAPRSLKFLLNEIDKEKYYCTVVCRTSQKDADFFKQEGVDVIFEPRIKPFHGSTVSSISFKQMCYNIAYALPSFFSMRKIVRKVNPDIVHLNSTCLFMCAAATKSVNRRIKVISHIREPLLNNFFGSILKVMCNKFCDRFIAIDEYDGKSVDPKGEKTSVIYNFVDFNKYRSDNNSNILQKELRLSAESVVFLVLARVSPENGIYELLNAWKSSVLEQKSHLVIVGELKGREEKYTKKCHEIADGEDNIHILPFRSDVCDVIASSDVSLCPFTKPHFARAIIEGAAMGKPALSRWIDGPKELIKEEETGLFYDKGNKHDLAEKVALLTENIELRKKLGRDAEAYARLHFNAEVNAVKTFEVYES